MNQISDVSPLANLKNLTELNISSSYVSDVSPLTGLKNLTILNISSSYVSDVSPLTGLKNLKIYHDNIRIKKGSIGGVHIPDRQLRRLIVYKITGSARDSSNYVITEADMRSITTIVQPYSRVHANSIRDLTGLEYATNLRRVKIRW